MGCTDVSSQSPFDLSTWYDITRGPSKGCLCEFGSSSSSTSVIVEDMRSNATNMGEEFSRQEEEIRKLLGTALEEVQKREEEARKRETDLQEFVRKLLQDVGYRKHQFAGKSE
ncbi:UNVERIFIED_CONTAM: hypothetical protein Sindi_2838200 [Sesamum indicum]